MKLNQPVIDEVLYRKQLMDNSKLYFPWIVLNACIVLLLSIDISRGSPFISSFVLPKWLVYAEYVLLTVFIFNLIYDLAAFLFPLFHKSSIALTASQRKLFGIGSNSSTYRIEQPSEPNQKASNPAERSLNTFESLCSSRSSLLSNSPASMLSQRNLSDLSMNANSTFSSPNKSLLNHSMSSYHSPTFHESSMVMNSSVSPSKLALSHSQNYLPRRRKSNLDSSSKLNSSNITNEQSLEKYLKEYEEIEQLSIRSLSVNSSPSFWSFTSSPVNDYTSTLMKSQYQIASRSPQSSTSHKDDVDSAAKYSNKQIWNKLNISSEQLDVWMERLRKWIAQTIIVDVVKQINSINKVLSTSASRSLKIGEVSITTLGQLAFTNGNQVPHLNTLLPFLDVSSNQEYLVDRLKNLANGSCMSAFKWNGGGTFKQKPWNEHLPADAMIVMHQLCSYLDTMTPFHPNFPDGKTFTSQHFIKTPDKPDVKKKDCLYIYQSQINPPVYKLIADDITYEPAEGRNNMFQVILLFLYHVKTYHEGMLGRLSLGKSGVNILCILDP